MRKLLISLSAIFMLVASATVASAAGGYVVDYNEDLSTADKAVVDIYIDVNSPEGFTSLACQIGLYDGATNVMKDYVKSAAVTPYGGLTSAQVKYQATQGLMMITGAGSVTTPLIVADDGHLGRFELTLKKELIDGLTFSRLATRDTAYIAISGGVAGSKVVTSALDVYDTVVIKPAEPTVETVNADTVALAAPGENEVAGTDVAAAYKATYNFVSGQTAAWTATGKADYPINLANVSGETTLGLIVTDAAVSNVALKVTTPAN